MEKLLDYAPLILAITMFFINYKVFVTPADLEKKHREIKEEMNFVINQEKLKQREVFENFFEIDGKEYHEIYFLYEYILDDEEVSNLDLSSNKDNSTTYFKFITTDQLENYNVLPTKLYKIIAS